MRCKPGCRLSLTAYCRLVLLLMLPTVVVIDNATDDVVMTWLQDTLRAATVAFNRRVGASRDDTVRREQDGEIHRQSNACSRPGCVTQLLSKIAHRRINVLAYARATLAASPIRATQQTSSLEISGGN